MGSVRWGGSGAAGTSLGDCNRSSDTAQLVRLLSFPGGGGMAFKRIITSLALSVFPAEGRSLRCQCWQCQGAAACWSLYAAQWWCPGEERFWRLFKAACFAWVIGNAWPLVSQPLSHLIPPASVVRGCWSPAGLQLSRGCLGSAWHCGELGLEKLPWALEETLGMGWCLKGEAESSGSLCATSSRPPWWMCAGADSVVAASVHCECRAVMCCPCWLVQGVLPDPTYRPRVCSSECLMLFCFVHLEFQREHFFFFFFLAHHHIFETNCKQNKIKLSTWSLDRSW